MPFWFPLPILLPLSENWQYIQTECANGWWPHNGFCYRLLSETEAGSWEESSRACVSQGANLTSLHSLSEVEMLLSLLTNCKERHSTKIYEVRFVIDTIRNTNGLLNTILCAFHSFRWQWGGLDWTLETGIFSNCRVVWWFTSNSHFLAPVSPPSQSDGCIPLCQSRQEGGSLRKNIIVLLGLQPLII